MRCNNHEELIIPFFVAAENAINPSITEIGVLRARSP